MTSWQLTTQDTRRLMTFCKSSVWVCKSLCVCVYVYAWQSGRGSLVTSDAFQSTLGSQCTARSLRAGTCFFYAQHPTCQPHRLLWRRIEGNVLLLSDMFIKHFHSKPVQLCYSTDYIWFKCFPTWSHHDFFQDRSSGEMLPHQQWTEI